MRSRFRRFWLRTGFSPTELPGGFAWWEVGNDFQDSAGTTPANDDDPLGRVTDDFGNGRHLQQATVGQRPMQKGSANGINGRSVSRSDGSDDKLIATADGTALTALSVLLVVRPRSSPSATRGLWQWANAVSAGSPFVLFERQSNNTDVKVFVNGGYRWTIAHADDVTRIYLLTWDGVTWNLSVDGVAQTPYVGAGAFQANAASVYWHNGFGGHSICDILANLIYSQVHSAGQQLDLVRSYGVKGGVTVP